MRIPHHVAATLSRSRSPKCPKHATKPFANVRGAKANWTKGTSPYFRNGDRHADIHREAHFKSAFNGISIDPKLFQPKNEEFRVQVVPVPPKLAPFLGRGCPYLLIESEALTPRLSPTSREFQNRTYAAKMLSYVQVVTTPTADTGGTALLLHFDTARYFFGAISEGTQRALIQRKIGIAKTEDVFVSGPVNWQNSGGLMGLTLTAADLAAAQRETLRERNEKQKKQKGKETIMSRLNIHGGRNMTHMMATARRFIFRQGLPLEINEIRDDPRAKNANNGTCSAEPDFQDLNIRVWYMPVAPRPAHSSSHSPQSSSSSSSSRKRSHDEMSSDGKKSEEESRDNSTANSEPNDGKSNDSEGIWDDEESYRAVAKVVGQMFNSNWRIDALQETTLHRVDLPATIWVRKNGQLQKYEGPLPGTTDNVPDIPVLVRRPWPAVETLKLPKTRPSPTSMSYIVKSHDRRGKFQLKEAGKYQVEKYDYAKLARGETVVAKDGTIVTSEMVLGETIQGVGFTVLDVPDVSYIEPLIHRPEWLNPDIMRGINSMFWMLGPGVVQNEQLQAFMKKNNSLRHIVCSPDTAPNMLAYESVSAQAYKLHRLDPERFLIPYYTNEISVGGKPTTSSSDCFETGRTGKMIQLSPQLLHKDDQIVPFPDLQQLTTQDMVPGALALAATAREKMRDPKFLQKIEEVESDIPNRDAEIVTLGTGSAAPSKYRNVSATLVRVPGYGSYLFDCGENTMGQLQRVFGSELPAVLRDLKVIWISHLHADHHLGTAGVVSAWHHETKDSHPDPKLMISSDVHMIDWLREYSDVEDFGYHRLQFASFAHYDPKTNLAYPQWEHTEQDQATFGVSSIEAVRVDHCFAALAIVITWPSGLKIAYSGDCRPSEPFVRVAQGATLLLHESTFDDELTGEAMAKKHCTMGEAIDVGKRMGARRIMLTHFSQRYSKLPIMMDEEDWGSSKADQESGEAEAATGKGSDRDRVVLVAFDYMRVRLGDFRKAQAFLPAIQKLLENIAQ